MVCVCCFALIFNKLFYCLYLLFGPVWLFKLNHEYIYYNVQMFQRQKLIRCRLSMREKHIECISHEHLTLCIDRKRLPFLHQEVAKKQKEDWR